MNGVHDMGGMQDMGPVQEEKNEPVFHQRWEGRVFAMYRAAWGLAQVEHRRRALPERTDSPGRISAHELLRKMVRGAGGSSDSKRTGHARGDRKRQARAGIEQSNPAAHGGKVPRSMRMGASASRDVPVAPRFQVGQRVRARNINPVGHTRLPRYARGKLGTIDRDHGVFVFPDTNAHFLGEKPQHVYSVRFAARELWGEQAKPQDAVYIDMWDDYLEPA